MRLSDQERDIIRYAIKTQDSKAKVYLFGSRANDNLRGGDIDILVISNRIDYKKKLAVRRELFQRLEDQKIDIVVSGNEHDPFVKQIMPGAVPL